MNDLQVTNKELTMSLYEVCDLLKVRHANAMSRVMPKLLVTEGFGACSQIEIVKLGKNGRKYPTASYLLTQRQCYMVAGMSSPEFLVRVFDRWISLENKVLDMQRLQSKIDRISDSLIEDRNVATTLQVGKVIQDIGKLDTNLGNHIPAMYKILKQIEKKL